MTSGEFIKKIPLAQKAKVVAAHESGLIAINKGPGISSHPNPGQPARQGRHAANARPAKQSPSFVLAPYNFDREYFSWRDEDGQKLRLYLVNRLDSPTSGIIIAATNEQAARAARQAFKEKTAKKTYYAICKGRPAAPKGLWSDSIRKISEGRHVRAAAGRGGEFSQTEFSLERMDSNGLGLSLVRLKPLTGRTHQLRVQCAQRGIPIIGDATYGDFAANKAVKMLSGLNRLFLHCAHTALEFEIGGEAISFSAEAPLPESFTALMEYDNKIFSAARKAKG